MKSDRAYFLPPEIPHVFKRELHACGTFLVYFQTLKRDLLDPVLAVIIRNHSNSIVIVGGKNDCLQIDASKRF